MKLLTTLFLLIVTMPINPAIRPYEPKPERQACSQKTYDAMCVPRIRTVEVNNKANWI